MSKFFLLFSFLFVLINVQGQDIPLSLSENVELIGMSYTPNEHYSIVPCEPDGAIPCSDKSGKYACYDNDCPLIRLQLMEAEFLHSDKQCKVFVYVSGANKMLFGKTIKGNSALFGEIASLSYNRIKSDFMYGRRSKSATEQEIEDIKMMLTYYPQDSAKLDFNADYMLTYPFNMEGKTYQDKFTYTRAVVAGKNGLDIFVYFVLTDESIKNFDKYLSDFKGILWYEDKEEEKTEKIIAVPSEERVEN